MSLTVNEKINTSQCVRTNTEGTVLSIVSYTPQPQVSPFPSSSKPLYQNLLLLSTRRLSPRLWPGINAAGLPWLVDNLILWSAAVEASSPKCLHLKGITPALANICQQIGRPVDFSPHLFLTTLYLPHVH